MHYKLYVWSLDNPNFKHISSYCEKYSEILKVYLTITELLKNLGVREQYKFQIKSCK